MPKFRRCVALLIALAACNAAAQDKVTIKPNLKANEAWKLQQVMDMNMNMTLSIGGQDQKMEQKVNVSMGAVITPLEVKDGAATKSKIKFNDDAKISVTAAGNAQNVPFPLAGKDLTITKKADGTVDVEPGGALDAPTKTMLGDMMDAAAAFYPTQPVGVGDKWEIPNEKIAKMFQMEPGAKGKIECTLTGIKGRTAEVSLKGTAAGKTQKVIDTTLDLAGPMTLDLDSGQVLSQNLKANMTMKGAPPGAGGATINGTGVITVNQTMAPAK